MMNPRGLGRSLRLPLSALSLVLASAAAPAQKSDAEIQDDIAFAKGLAQDWGFVDLATDVITRIEKEGIPARQREQLGVTKCEIFEVAAINERDRERRNVLFEAALKSFADFIQQNPVSAALPEAERGFVRISSLYARSLEISLEDAVGEQAEALRQRRIEVLTEAVAKTMSQINALSAVGHDQMTEAQKTEMSNLMLDRGRMLLDLGRSQDEGAFSFEQALQILEAVVFEVGEGTPAALRAYDLIGQVNAARGDVKAARDYFEAVVEQAIPSDPTEWETMVREQELTPADKEKRWMFVELSTEGLVDSYLSMGEAAMACKYALHLYNTWKREGFELSPQLGYPSLLAAARALLESSGWIGGNTTAGEAKWYATEEEMKAAGETKRNQISCTDLALQIAQQVNKDNQGNVLQIRAQKLMASIINQPGVVVAPAVLYEAAEGDYNERNDEAALAGFRRVLAALEGQDRAAQLEFSPRIYFRMGRTYQRMERPLEAALAYQEGCTTWVGDPEYDGENAQGFYRSMQTVVQQSPGDAPLKTLMELAEKTAAELSNKDKNSINYDLGAKAERNEDYATAIQYYGEVQPAGLDYEKALVNIAVCKVRMGQIAEAQKLFDDYLEVYVKDPKTDPGASQAKIAKRADAMAMAEYWRGQIHFKIAEKAQSRVDLPPEEVKSLFELVVGLIGTYHERYPTQTDFTPRTLNSLMLSYLALGDIAKARSTYELLVQNYPDHKIVAAASVSFYNNLKDLQAAAASAGEVDRAAQLLREMAGLLELGNRNSAKSDFAGLRRESSHWMDLAEYAKAEIALEKLRAEFASSTDEKIKSDMVKYVLPDLAHALLQQHKVTPAHEILLALMDDPTDKPGKRTGLDYCRSVTGWVEGEGTDVELVAGAGQTEAEYQRATETLAAIAQSVDAKWTCEWYAYQFQLAWSFYAWATQDWSPNKDTKKKDTAQRTLKVLVGELGSQFKGDENVAGIDVACESVGGEDQLLYGGDKLRRRFVWLWGKVQ